MQVNYDIEHLPQEGEKNHAGSTPERLRVWTRDAVGNTFCTCLSRWDDKPFTVDKRTKKANRYNQPDARPKTVTPKVTDTVREVLESEGYEIA